MKSQLFSVFLMYSGSVLYSQTDRHVKTDTLETGIEEIVLTGQYGNRSIKKSLYKVEVITKEQISKLSLNNVAEVLNQNLNILITPDQNSGNSKINIGGLGANYTKILVDNIPLVGDEGLGSNIDLTKINLNNVERIEIVKGSMGVEFGNSAVAGVINIITKFQDSKKWNFRGYVQEETVGKEYDWINYGKGRHIQSLAVSHNFNENWFANLSFNRNDFQGFWGEKKGKNYFERDHLRGYLWQPKEQVTSSLNVKFSKKNTQLFYKADFLSEKVNFYNPIVEQLNLGGGERTFIAKDRNYNTERWLHHLGFNTVIFANAKINTDFSYQKQTRKNQDYVFDVPAREIRTSDPENIYYQSETFYSRGSIFNFLNNERTDAQIGYEADYTRGFAGWSTASFGGNNIEKSIFSGGIFASGEFKINQNWFLRPGIRYNFSNVFKTKPNFSLVAKNQINNRSEFRIIVGSSNRNPTFEELYTHFVDSNHDIRGNENLKPENSYSGALYYSISSEPENVFKWNLDFNTIYLQVHDRISMAVTNNTPLQYKYININTFESWLNSFSAKLKHQNWALNAGISLIGKSNQIYQDKDEPFYYTPELNASLFYDIPKSKTSFSLLYKWMGKSLDIMEYQALGMTQYQPFERKAFSMLDFSVSQKFWKDHFGLTLGIRNILDVTEVESVSSGTGAHGNSNSTQMLFYGRSFFGRLNFNF